MTTHTIFHISETVLVVFVSACENFSKYIVQTFFMALTLFMVETFLCYKLHLCCGHHLHIGSNHMQTVTDQCFDNNISQMGSSVQQTVEIHLQTLHLSMHFYDLNFSTF